jgi:putative ABC transport system permease protein
MDTTADEVGGIMVLDINNRSPAFSRISPETAAEVATVKGVGAVAREIISPVLKMEGKPTLIGASIKQGIPFYVGVDPLESQQLRGGGYFTRHLVEGVTLPPEPSNLVMMSRDLAERYHKELGSKVSVMDTEFEVCGIFETTNPLFQSFMVIHLERAAAFLQLKSGVVTVLFVEATDPEDTEALADRLTAQVPAVDAMSTEEWAEVYGELSKQVDLFLAIITSFAVVVGAIGIANTMLMSVTERVGEFGVLRATGWRRVDVLRLVLTESFTLGVVGGLLGLGLGAVAGRVIGGLVDLQPVISAQLAALALGLSAVTGSLGGLYPAWRAANLDVVDALRFRS